jgi:hypothetical protein
MSTFDDHRVALEITQVPNFLVHLSPLLSQAATMPGMQPQIDSDKTEISKRRQ